MSYIYLDYNILSIIAGRTRRDAEHRELHVHKLIESGHNIVLSAWHAVELARSTQEPYVRASISLVNQLNPHWLSDSRFVKKNELMSYLAECYPDDGYTAAPSFAFNITLSQMWSTYGAQARVGETFEQTVSSIRAGFSNPQNHLGQAMNNTSHAIETNREAESDGVRTQLMPLVDRAYLQNISPPRAHRHLDELVARINNVRAACPTIAAEHALTDIRAGESFTPEVVSPAVVKVPELAF